MPNEVWILGATGRTGEAIGEQLTARGATPVLVGRNREKLEALSAPAGSRVVVAESPADMAAAIRREEPAVVVNTVGPFRQTAGELTKAAAESGGHYIDLANDLATILGHRERDDAARRSGQTIVTGAGFGVTATESLLTWLTAGLPPASKARIDMIPAASSAAGRVGDAIAGSLLDGIPGTPGGGRYESRVIADARLASAPLFGRPTSLVTPDGDTVTTALAPLAELLAAQRASGAPAIESASSESPTGVASMAIRAVLPWMHLGPLRRSAVHLLSAVKTPERAASRRHSWAHARAEWANGTVREGWLRWGDANNVTAAVAAEVAARLAADQGKPGVYTPAELFGPGLAESCGGAYSLATQN
ncbi:saccharopine dehydrogenase NADP-binding domain-containing protein [Gordonia liuliyuniae]|uniref:Saccharopine dehydrogenase NADP-binding domain-containing protein n=1 Tax=Gordonia liuliyuniae TaxID=2911517 RepID=A0ABS9ITT4_9ACTN|nr:saccharopine dehydrogenase NADP-binding domain-containing protein [Gordonia liuliyuniae]MCF8588969.1 saccharopine dehydrogenase NADP-binding domain-containing protein [Gordonia liuliyuniae]